MNRIFWNMALREIRGGLHYLSYFFVCVALGVAGVSGVLGFSAGMKTEIDLRAKSLMAGDIEVRTHSRLKSETRAAISDSLGNQSSSAGIMELAGMVFVPESGKSQLVEIKSVSSLYPLYGKVSTLPEESFPHLFNGPSVLVEESLLLKLGLKVGDKINLGNTMFKILAVITSEPDRLSGPFSLGPRIMMSSGSLDLTELVQTGSRIRYRYIYKLPRKADLNNAVEKIKNLIDDSRVDVNDYKKSQKRFLRFFNNITSYLHLLVIAGLILGGAGVGVSMHLFMQKKMDNIAVLKSLGAGSRTVMGIYLRVVLLVSGVASITGVLLGALIQYSISSLFKGLTPFQTSFTLSPGPVFEGILVGISTSFLFSVWPLIKVGSVKPSLILLRDVDQRFQLKSKKPFVWIVVTACGLSVIVLQQAGSLYLGGIFIGVIAGAIALLQLVTSLFLYIMRKFAKPTNLCLRMGIRNVTRPGNTTATAVTAVGVMGILIMTVGIVKIRIINEIETDLSKNAPAFYFIDIQKEQKEAFNLLMEKMSVKSEIYPIVRGRLHSLDGKLVKDLPATGKKNRWHFKREYAVTTKLYPSSENRVVSGKWWTEDEFKKMSLLSVDRDIAKSLEIGVGSTVELDIQGKILHASVSNIRKVDWSGLSPNFFMVFTHKAMDRFTHSYIASARVPKDMDITLQDSVVSMFPNITVINIRTILKTLHNTLEQLSSIIEFLGKITITISFIVLLAVISLTQAYSLKELKIMRTFGATTQFIGKIKSVEYGIIGIIAGLISLAISLLLGFLVIHFFMKLSFEISPVFILKALLGTLFFTMAAGFFNVFFLYKRKVSRIFFE